MTHANRLINEKSPYLLQHANNPVDWYPWGKDAFEKARREDKPIFLSVGYSTCHWCHVMERESFENQEIARLINDGFVPIKVDREERPDIDQVYLEAVQAIAGRGGWPMSVFLMPDGRPFSGGTYFPPEQFKQVLARVSRMYREERAKVEAAAVAVTESVAAMVGRPRPPAQAEPTERLVRRALDVLRRSFDAAHGGFGGAPKFPPHSAIALLLHEHTSGADETLLPMVTATLDGMALGGIHDHIGGGFHRYATDERWFLPHFEKMLYDNALMLRNYAQAHAVTGDPLYRQVADSLLAWIGREMTSPEGAFYSALDAESEGVEGKFYLWRRAEIMQTLGEEEGRLFCAVYGIEEQGNYREEASGSSTGENIPYLRRRLSASAQELGLSPADPSTATLRSACSAEVASATKAGREATSLRSTSSLSTGLESRLAAAREKLLAARERRPRPHRDDKIITSWNGLMIGSLAYAGRALGEPHCTEMAQRAAGFVLDNLYLNKRLLRRWREGEAKHLGCLDDYTYLACGLLELHRTTRDRHWLDRARELMDAAITRFWDERPGGFFYTASEAERLFVRPKEALDHPLPSGNGMAALALLHLGELTGERRYLTHAERTLRAMAPWMERSPYGTDTLALAASIHLARSAAGATALS
jgi:uncharacterized protein YyaL (SSP411 family)